MSKKSIERREKWEAIRVQKIRSELIRKARYFDYVTSNHYLNRREHGLFTKHVQEIPLRPDENKRNAYIDVSGSEEDFASRSFGVWVKTHDTRYDGTVLSLESICGDVMDGGWNKTEDEILRYERQFLAENNLPHANFDRDFMKNAVVIVADDIAKTLNAVDVGLHDDNWSGQHWPNELLNSTKVLKHWVDTFKTPLTPQFDSMFVEFIDQDFSDDYITTFYGCYVMALYSEDNTICGFKLNPMNSVTYAELQNSWFGFSLDEHGLLTDITIPPVLEPFDVEAVFVTLKTIALMNCKNIELKEAETNSEFAQVYKQYMGKNPAAYKTLRLKPMGKRTENDTLPKDYQGLMPLHLRRGNFATYTDEKPLFGKYTGTFWRPATAVGEQKNGVIIKDYEVQP